MLISVVIRETIVECSGLKLGLITSGNSQRYIVLWSNPIDRNLIILLILTVYSTYVRIVNSFVSPK
jgi:hypothetical protein